MTCANHKKMLFNIIYYAYTQTKWGS